MAKVKVEGRMSKQAESHGMSRSSIEIVVCHFTELIGL
jgi:hypothetical protein